MHRVIISLGSNIDPVRNISRAIRILSRRYTLLKESTIQETLPLGNTDQPNFLNGAVLVETNLGLQLLKNELKSIELELGRVKNRDVNGPRTIDLDIVVWNGEIVDQEVHSRSFLKESILELWPDLDLSNNHFRKNT